MGQDNGMDCEPSWAELSETLEETQVWLRDARDTAIHYKIQHEAALERIAELERYNVGLASESRALQEREQALAAHVARFHALANTSNLMDAIDVCDELVSIDEDTPAESLVIVEALWKRRQAEGSES